MFNILSYYNNPTIEEEDYCYCCWDVVAVVARKYCGVASENCSGG